jgi:hypothetical protein
MQNAESILHSVTVDASQTPLSFGEVSGHIRDRGLCIVRHCLPSSGLSGLLTDFQTWYEAARGNNESGQSDFALLNGLTSANIPGFSERLVTLVGGSAFPDIARDYLNCARENLVVPENHILLRVRDDYTNAKFLDTGASLQGFHQDYALIPTSFPVNMWIPFSKIDRNCIGLSFVLPFTGAIYDNPFDVHKMLEETGSAIVTPELNVGDVILFNHKTLHGLSTAGRAVNPRYSVEFRIGSDAILPPDYADRLYRFDAAPRPKAAPAFQRLWQSFLSRSRSHEPAA